MPHRRGHLRQPVEPADVGEQQPDFGVVDEGRIEAELAFVLARDLDRAGEIDADDVRAVTDYVVPALEIVDSRVAEWDISIVDTVADNGSSGLFVLGDARVGIADVQPADIIMRMTRTGAGADPEIVSEGTGADCLGDPLAAVAWLATAARDRGSPLRAGDIILSGALGHDGAGGRRGQLHRRPRRRRHGHGVLHDCRDPMSTTG